MVRRGKAAVKYGQIPTLGEALIAGHSRRHRSCGRIHTENFHVGNQGKALRGGQGVWVFIGCR